MLVRHKPGVLPVKTGDAIRVSVDSVQSLLLIALLLFGFTERLE